MFLINRVTAERFYTQLHLINDGYMCNTVDSLFELTSFLRPMKRKRLSFQNPCGEILLGKPQLCVLGTRGIWSPYQMTTFWGITYVIVPYPDGPGLSGTFSWST